MTNSFCDLPVFHISIIDALIMETIDCSCFVSDIEEKHYLYSNNIDNNENDTNNHNDICNL